MLSHFKLDAKDFRCAAKRECGLVHVPRLTFAELSGPAPRTTVIPEGRNQDDTMTTDTDIERTRDQYRALSSAELERRLDLQDIGEPGSWQITVALAVLDEKNRHGRLECLLQDDDNMRALDIRSSGVGIAILMGGACLMFLLMLILMLLRVA
jgi:hypothetical protein